MDLAGRVYAQDRCSHAVHVFGSDGSRLRLCTPQPTDFAEAARPRELSVGPDGSVYLRSSAKRSRGESIQYLAFGSEGRRLGWVAANLDWVSEVWRFKPEGGERWVLGYRELFLVDADGLPKRTIARQPDRRWLRALDDAAVAPDGSVAILSTPPYRSFDGEHAVHVYDPEGESLQSFDLPSDVRDWHPALVWTGRWLVVARDGGRFLVVDRSTGARHSFRPDGVGTDRYLEPFLSGGGRELWLIERDARRVTRYSLPSD